MPRCAAFFGSYGLKLTMSLFPLFMLGLYYLSGFYVNVTNKSRVKEFLSTGMSVAIGAFIFFYGRTAQRCAAATGDEL